MATRTADLWGLVPGRQRVGAGDLTDAVEAPVASGDLDYHTRLPIRDSLDALRHAWGDARLEARLRASSPFRAEIEAIRREEFERVGFRSLKDRVVEVTQPETIRQYFRELSGHVRRPLRLSVGGSAALILPGRLSRKTEDIGVVDEVPAEIRTRPRLLEDLTGRYGLALAHIRQRYLPSGWENRLHHLDTFGALRVDLVDVYDVFPSKLFSARPKDRDDLRALAPQLDKEALIRRLRETTASMLAAGPLRQRAEQNWYILYGESLPA